MSTGLPNVSITLLNGQLGRVTPSEDKVAGLVLSGVDAAGIDIGESKQLFALTDAEDLGLTEAYDTTNETDVWKQIKEFYDRAGNGAELWVHLIAKTTTMTSACDVTNNIVKKLLNDASGRITMWGIARTPDDAYTPSYTGQLDGDVQTAVTKAHALCESFAGQFKPCRALIGARDFQGTAASLTNFRANATNRVGVVLFSTSDSYNAAEYNNASVGFVLGQFMNRPVMRNIARVKDGDLGINAAYFTNAATIETLETALDSIHDKGYIIARKFYGKNGYYFNDDPAACPLSDDYSSLARGRVIDKAIRIAYTTFVNEIQDDIDIDTDGYMSPAVVKDYQKKIEQAITLQMITTPAEAEISGVRCIMNPAQQVSVTDQVQIEKLAIRPKGYSKYIDVNLGFEVSSN